MTHFLFFEDSCAGDTEFGAIRETGGEMQGDSGAGHILRRVSTLPVYISTSVCSPVCMNTARERTAKNVVRSTSESESQTASLTRALAIPALNPNKNPPSFNFARASFIIPTEFVSVRVVSGGAWNARKSFGDIFWYLRKPAKKCPKTYPTRPNSQGSHELVDTRWAITTPTMHPIAMNTCFIN